MFNKKYLLIAICLTGSPVLSMAKSLPLVDSCVELINIYDTKNSQRLLAAQTTSLSESLRAGYCLGVLEQYEETKHSCRADWFKRAKFIASYTLETNPPSERRLLELSCEI
ncbi:hypothetical protein ASV53_19745 [Photobacterium sanguinicancri]|uniref:DUF1311 domain-containing protein n=2 Tax=Photobacterium sanguinicancri TaxID=875932 RepID=A0ABX4FTK6_9GAMM|nr:hypothetical protein ASV53_19745 [Photobacterium sanguinicancri]